MCSLKTETLKILSTTKLEEASGNISFRTKRAVKNVREAEGAERRVRMKDLNAWKDATLHASEKRWLV